MASSSNIVQAIGNALQGTIAPDTTTIKAATKQLTTLYNNPQSLPALFEIGTTSQNPAIRQLALVELRKRIPAKKARHWLHQPQNVRSAIKARLLEIVLSEQSASARAAATRCISTIARLELPNKAWPELLPWLWSSIQAQQPTQREVALQCLYALLDTVILGENSGKPEEIAQHIPQLLGLFQKTLTDEYQPVRVSTVKALGKLSEFIETHEEPEVAAFQQLVPGIVQVIQQSLDSDDEAGVKAGLDVIETITFSEAPLLTPHVPALVHFLLQTSSNTNYDNEMRIALLNALLWIVKFKKGKIQSLNIAGSIIQSLLPIGAEADPVDADDDSASRTAFRVIDTLATSLPPAQVFPPLFEQVREFASSPDPFKRKSAITAFGVVVEGCSLFIQPHLDSLWPLVEGGLGDSEGMVRKAACHALGCLCEMLEEECAKRHATLLPLIFKLVGDEQTQRAALVALDCLLEVLGSDIEPYIPSLMESLLALLDSSSLKTKATVVGAIGSAAHASKSKFAPYFEPAVRRILPFLQLTEEGEELELRGIAQDTVGTLAEAVGKDAFRSYYEPCLKIAYQATMADLPKASNLKECSYIFFAVISRVYGEEFAAQLPAVMPILLAAVQQGEIDDALLTDGVDEVDDALANGDGGDFEDIDEDEEIASDDEADALFSASTAIAIEKECAIDALGEIFSNVKNHFLPYLESTINAILPGLKHDWHDGIRKASASALLGFISTFNSMANDGKKWQKGGSTMQRLPENVMQLINHILPAIFDMWSDEEERDVVNELCVAFSTALMAVGPGLVVPDFVKPLCEHLDLILTRKAPCQIADAEDEEFAANAEQSEYDAALIASACDLVGSLASVLGSDFAQVFPTFLPSMAQYYDMDKTVGDRSTAIGSLAETVNGMEGAVTPFTDSLFQLFVRALQDPESEVRSNAAFAIGSLLYHTTADLSGQYMTVLQYLQPLFRPAGAELQNKEQNALDNACGAVARMILKTPSALPLDQVVPVLIDALPLRRDFAESEKTYEALFSLVQSQNAQAVERLSQILRVFAVGLASCADGKSYPDDEGAQLSEETRNRTIEFVKAVNASASEQVQAAGLGPYLA